ncbi:MAG TPA: redox-regulated ATPase YchF [Acidobacteriota bacterium]|nr:redox-regulated ATPase YchF [Acidobacteriota bacterium]
MKIGIVGLPLSGKTELFEALTGAEGGPGAAFSVGNGQERRAVVKVPDERLERLSSFFCPKKTTSAAIEYLDFSGLQVSEEGRQGFSNQFLGTARTADALLVVVRAFTDERVPHPLKTIDPVRDLKAVETEFVLSDLAIVESRLERLAKQVKSQKNERDLRELRILERCRAFLESEKPLREFAFEREDELLVRGFRFLTQKPLIVVVNIDEGAISREAEVRDLFAGRAKGSGTEVLCLSARIEREIQQLSGEEASQFLKDFGLSHSARARLIATSYRLLGLISFFTVGEDEVKAWTVPAATRAVHAAGTIHSDIERGFIRAEVVSYDDFIVRESLVKCKSDGTVRLEGKDYPVSDGDIVNFRFAV